MLAQLAISYICGNIGSTEVQEAQQVAAHAHNLEAQAHAHAEAQVQAAVQAHSLAAKAQAHANAQVTSLPQHALFALLKFVLVPGLSRTQCAMTCMRYEVLACNAGMKLPVSSKALSV